jgi:hypothetical protein
LRKETIGSDVKYRYNFLSGCGMHSRFWLIYCFSDSESPLQTNRKRHFSESADTALFSERKNAPLFCIKIRVQVWLKTAILIQCTLSA